MEKTRQEQYVEFGVGKEKYALRIQDIHEIIKMQDITKVPNLKTFVKGVINLRGKIVPIVSLRELFRIPEEASPTASTRIIVVCYCNETVGIVVDRVNKVTTFSDIQTPPERIGSLENAFFSGIGVSSEGLVGVLKLDEILLQE